MKKYKVKNNDTFLTETDLKNWFYVNNILNGEKNKENDFEVWLQANMNIEKLQEVHGLSIRISYQFCTDGDYTLQTPEKFNAKRMDFDDYGYFGSVLYEFSNKLETKMAAKNFLEKLLCEGIQVSSSHYELLGSFFTIIDNCIHFINDCEHEDEYSNILSGNYDGTYIKIVVKEF